MKILMTGDWQVNGRRDDYMSMLEACVDYFLSVVVKTEPDFVVNLGDVMDTKNLVDVEDLVWAYQSVNKISNLVPQKNPSHWTPKPRHVILKGNHDLSDKNGNVASIQVMESDNTRICMHAEILHMGPLRVMVLPYTENIEGTYKWIEQQTSPPHVIIGHVDWIGCRLTPAYVSKNGFDPAWFHERFPGVPIFNGHYHHPMSLGNLHMVGSPVHKDFNDVVGPIERGFTLWDSETGTIERIPNPCTYYCLQLTYENEDSLESGWKELRSMAENLRVKVFVPNKLLADAKEMFKDFLWSAVIPIESDAISLQHASEVTVQSTKAEVLQKGVDAAPDEYDKEMLYSLGRQVFGV